MGARLKAAITIGVLGLAAVAAGCGGGNDSPAVSPPLSVTAPTVSVPTSTVTVPGDVDAGRTVFEQTCQTCHPAGGTTAGAGPQLAGMGLTLEQIRHQITNPRLAMPPNLVSGADLENVSAYVLGIQ